MEINLQGPLHLSGIISSVSLEGTLFMISLKIWDFLLSLL